MTEPLLIQPAILDALKYSLGPIRDHNFNVASVACPSCNFPVRFPLIAREEDVRAFQRLMTVAHDVLERHGVTAALLAEVQAACYIELARRGGKE